MKPFLFRLMSRASGLQDIIAIAMAAIPAALPHNIGKYQSLKKAFYLNALDGTGGDYLEFGVFTGSSLAAAARFSRASVLPNQGAIRFFGFDSFQGFGTLTKEEQEHPFFQDNHFQSDLDRVRSRLLKVVKDPSRLVLVPGFFDATLRGKSPKDYGVERAGVVMIDCDTFSAASDVFTFVAPCLQEGTILVIDDFFSFKGSTRLGVCGAFRAFEKANKEWEFRYLSSYGYGGAVYIAAVRH